MHSVIASLKYFKYGVLLFDGRLYNASERQVVEVISTYKIHMYKQMLSVEKCS